MQGVVRLQNQKAAKLREIFGYKIKVQAERLMLFYIKKTLGSNFHNTNMQQYYIAWLIAVFEKVVPLIVENMLKIFYHQFLDIGLV